MDNSVKEHFGAAVRALRKKKAYSQCELAERIGTTQAQLSDIELGKSNPTIDMIYRIANALDVHVCELFATPEWIIDYFHRLIQSEFSWKKLPK